MWFFIAAGPAIGRQAPTDQTNQLVFSGNWAAVIGAFVCLVLLLAWAHYKMEELDDADKDKTPGDTNSPDEGP